MDQGVVLDIARQGMIVGFLVTLPVLAIALFIGMAISVFQALTQVQEMTLTFVPKLVGAALVVVAMGSWMLSTLVNFTLLCFEQVARVGQ